MLFKNLEQNGTSTAKVYAIKALEQIDYEYYCKLFQKHADNNETAIAMSGCIIYEIKLCELFGNIDNPD